MIGAGVRTSAESWELNVCVSPPSCVWQGGGEHVHETCLDLSLLFIVILEYTELLLDGKRGRRSHSSASLSCSCL